MTDLTPTLVAKWWLDSVTQEGREGDREGRERERGKQRRRGDRKEGEGKRSFFFKKI